MGRTVGYLPHVGKATILMNDHPMIKYALIFILGLLVISGREGWLFGRLEWERERERKFSTTTTTTSITHNNSNNNSCCKLIIKVNPTLLRLTERLFSSSLCSSWWIRIIRRSATRLFATDFQIVWNASWCSRRLVYYYSRRRVPTIPRRWCKNFHRRCAFWTIFGLFPRRPLHRRVIVFDNLLHLRRRPRFW